MADVLEKILAARRIGVAAAKKQIPLSTLEASLKTVRPRSSFLKAISQKGVIGLIAEMKRKSPSAGLIRDPFNVSDIAEAYRQAGASAVSVLTEQHFFDGKIDDVKTVASVSSLPILRKDFIFDPYQIVEAKAAGASAVLLIADMVDSVLLLELAATARQYQLDTLVEIFTAESIEPALRTESKIIGINSRNLRTLEMHADHVVNLGSKIPADRILVAESGIKTADDVKKLKTARISAMLVGESLLKQSDLVAATKILVEAGRNL